MQKYLPDYYLMGQEAAKQSIAMRFLFSGRETMYGWNIRQSFWGESMASICFDSRRLPAPVMTWADYELDLKANPHSYSNPETSSFD